jgi:endonuclease-3
MGKRTEILKNPEKVEIDLNAAIPRERWVWIGHALILHGRRICSARKPRCAGCPLEDLCPKRGVAA